MHRLIVVVFSMLMLVSQSTYLCASTPISVSHDYLIAYKDTFRTLTIKNPLLISTDGLLMPDAGSHLLQLVASKTNPVVDAEASAQINVFQGQDATSWQRGVPVYESVMLQEVYSGVDMKYYLRDGELEFDFLIASGIDPSKVRMLIHPDAVVKIEVSGDVSINYEQQNYLLRAPVSYQIIDGKRTDVDSRFLLRGNILSFDVAAYDTDLPLVIDPVITYSSYIGGTGNDDAFTTVLMGDYLYVAGTTESVDFTTMTPYQTSLGSIRSAFVQKYDITGVVPVMVYSTYMGTDVAEVRGLAVDDHESVYLTGSTSAIDFPVMNAMQSTNAGFIDGFLTKLTVAGDALVYSTYFGGTSLDRSRALVVDSSGHAFVTGVTASTDFPVVNAHQMVNAGSLDAVVLKFSVDGGSLMYSTYFGGTGLDYGLAVDVSTSGTLLIAGFSNSSDLQVPGATQLVSAGANDAYVAEFDVSGSLQFGDYIGGLADDVATAVGYSTDEFVVYGQTASADFPITQGQAFAGGDSFQSVYRRSDNALLYRQLFGGSDSEATWNMSLDERFMYITGSTRSTDLPLLNAVQISNGGGEDGFFACLEITTGATCFSSYIGGNNTDIARGIDKQDGLVAVTMSTESTDNVLVNAIDTTPGGARDAFITLIDIDLDDDGVDDHIDNCPSDANTLQLDTDADGNGDVCDEDDDGDGLSDSFEMSIGTNTKLQDTDNDGLSDYAEVAYDGDATTYTVGVDTDPNQMDSDSDSIIDGLDNLPLNFHFLDADLAPLGMPDGIINAADLLIAKRLVSGYINATTTELLHGDVYPVAAPDGQIDIHDLIKLGSMIVVP